MDCTPKGILAADGVSTIDRDQFIAIFKSVRDSYADQLRAARKGDLFQGAKVCGLFRPVPCSKSADRAASSSIPFFVWSPLRS
jgi:hypothetical protein